jgi:predicted MFS family arabinose efflux permease
MPRSPTSTSSTAGHLAIGLGLGVGLALVLLSSSHPPIFQLLLNDSSPTLALALYIGIFAIAFGLGSTATGLLLDETDES